MTAQILMSPERGLWPIDQSVFLAGSIEMGQAEDWQTKFTKAVELYDVQIFNPRRDDWDSSWVQDMANHKFYEQVTWELDHLESAKNIVVNFDPATMSPITLLELGLHARSGKMMVCCPDGFWRKGNVEIVCQRYGIPFFHDFDDLVKAYVRKISVP